MAFGKFMAYSCAIICISGYLTGLFYCFYVEQSYLDDWGLWFIFIFWYCVFKAIVGVIEAWLFWVFSEDCIRDDGTAGSLIAAWIIVDVLMDHILFAVFWGDLSLAIQDEGAFIVVNSVAYPFMKPLALALICVCFGMIYYLGKGIWMIIKFCSGKRTNPENSDEESSSE